MSELTTVEAFRLVVTAKRGIVVIDDRRRRTAVAHSATCEHIREDRFVEKVIRNHNGSYYWGPDLVSLKGSTRREIQPCRVCGAHINPARQRT